jgi:hypothetical protein
MITPKSAERAQALCADPSRLHASSEIIPETCGPPSREARTLCPPARIAQEPFRADAPTARPTHCQQPRPPDLHPAASLESTGRFRDSRSRPSVSGGNGRRSGSQCLGAVAQHARCKDRQRRFPRVAAGAPCLTSPVPAIGGWRGRAGGTAVTPRRGDRSVVPIHAVVTLFTAEGHSQAQPNEAVGRMSK